MDRRKFLQRSSLLAAPLLLRGLPVSAAPSTGNKMLDALAQSAYTCGKILVIVQMNGGNDALNTIFPLDKWSNLSNARSNILMSQSSVLTLNNNITTGLHPALAEIRNMYNDGKIMIVQGVSYPNPNFSHFRATDIWFSASGSETVLETGWLGRSLDNQFPGFPTGYPNTDMPDPLAIQIGSTLPFSLQGPSINMGYNVPDPDSLLNVINGITDPAPNNDYGRELSFLRLMKDQSNAYKTVIQDAYNIVPSQTATYPSGNLLADQLKIVARLVNGGLKTPVYIVNHPNTHDTHSAQVITSDKTTGTQANNLSILSQAISAFQTDLELMGKQDSVTGMTYSEFGRRIISNASFGTDHGSAAPVIFFGAKLNTNPIVVAGTPNPVPGMIGTSPNIPLNATVTDQVPMQYDFRQLYATVMQDWLCMSEGATTDMLGSAYTKLPIFENLVIVPLDGVQLNGEYLDGQAKLSYHVDNNTRYESFIVEYGTDGTHFNAVNEKHNNSLNNSESYNYDYSINATKMYFRVAAKDRQGEVFYSNILLLRNTDKQQFISVYPNPVVNNTINIRFHEVPKSWVDITIFSIAGSKMYYNRFSQVSNTLSFKVSGINPREHYIMKIVYDSITTHEQIMFE